MSDRVKHKSRVTDRSAVRSSKKKKLRKRSSSSSKDCTVITTQKGAFGKDKKRKSRKKKRRRSSSSGRSSSDSGVVRLKLGGKQKQLLGERPEFCRNTARQAPNSGNGATTKSHGMVGSRSTSRGNDAFSRVHFSTIERRVLGPLISEKGRKRAAKEQLGNVALPVKKSKKSRKRKRSSSRSSLTSDSDSSQSSSLSESSSRSSSSSSGSSSSSTTSYERRRRRKRKKKLARRMKREEKKKREERRKLKKMKEKSRVSKEIKRGIIKVTQDRLLKDINVELADRARAMAPMTREQWEKKQSVIRRVYDEATGRQRLIKGDGEVLEEIVSRDRHMAINKQATKGDGDFFQSRLRVNK